MHNIFRLQEHPEELDRAQESVQRLARKARARMAEEIRHRPILRGAQDGRNLDSLNVVGGQVITDPFFGNQSFLDCSPKRYSFYSYHIL